MERLLGHTVRAEGKASTTEVFIRFIRHFLFSSLIKCKIGRHPKIIGVLPDPVSRTRIQNQDWDKRNPLRSNFFATYINQSYNKLGMFFHFISFFQL